MAKVFRNGRSMIVIVLMLMLMIGYFYHISNRDTSQTTQAESEKSTSVVASVLLRNLERNYPSTPKEVIKYYAELNQVLYSEEYSEVEFRALASKMRLLFDEELVANQPDEEYQEGLKDEIESFRKNNWVISSFATSASTDVERFTQDGFEFARLYCTFTIRQSGSYGSTQEVFLLRKASDGHWKIYGWQLVKD